MAGRSGSPSVITIGRCLAQLGAKVTLAPFIATISDQVPKFQRGSGSALLGADLALVVDVLANPDDAGKDLGGFNIDDGALDGGPPGPSHSDEVEQVLKVIEDHPEVTLLVVGVHFNVPRSARSFWAASPSDSSSTPPSPSSR